MIEEWKPVLGYEDRYKISNLWNIKSVYFKKWTYRKWFIQPSWHRYLSITINWVGKKISISRSVAIAFIPNPENKPLVCHKDETLTNWALYNWLDNLFWGTHSDNAKDMYRKWRANSNFKLRHPHKWLYWKNHFKSIKVNQLLLSWEFIKEWWSIIDIERELWIKRRNIWKCCRKIYWYKTAWWYRWEYKI